LTVELVDRSGATLKTPMKGFRNLAAQKTVTVKGKLVVKGGSFIIKVSDPQSLYVE